MQLIVRMGRRSVDSDDVTRLGEQQLKAVSLLLLLYCIDSAVIILSLTSDRSRVSNRQGIALRWGFVGPSLHEAREGVLNSKRPGRCVSDTTGGRAAARGIGTRRA